MASRIRTHLLLHTLHGLENQTSTWSVAAWQPHVDVYEMEESIVILVEAPGLETDNLKLQFEPGQLVVEGFRTRPPLPDLARPALVEIHYGVFKRQFALPINADGEAISATYDAGIFQITIPRRQAPAPISIQIR